MSEVYLSGEAPHVTKVDGTPTSVKVRVLDRVNSTLVAELMSDIDGSWRVDGINPTRTYDIIFSHDGYKDEIISDVKPIGYTGGVIEPFDPHWDKVVALLHFDGDIVDETRKVWSANGSATISDNSLYIPSNNSNITLDGYSLGDGDFTVEAKVKIENSMSNSFTCFDCRSMGVDANGLVFYVRPNGKIVIGGGSPFVGTEGDNFPMSEWVHVAFVRKSGVIDGYINGISSVSRSSSVNLNRDKWYVGSNSSGLADAGYIDELRITKGVARYTENFTPPTEPFPNRGP